MNTYSQNREDLFIANYFGDFKGNLLDIGANDGITFSNSRLLIENGWKATLIEPGDEYESLEKLYSENSDVRLYNYGIGDKTEKITFWQSDAHVKNGKDTGLVSTFAKSELERWPDVNFTEKTIRIVEFNLWYNWFHKPVFNFISIDAEGYDWKILQQIDLKDTRCLCIEWNSDPALLKLYTEYCKGFKIAVKNAENLIFCR
jgi:FkbM family methyltransferase